MKKTKASKILLCALSVVFICLVDIQAAQALTYQSRSVAEMMDRRRNVKPVRKTNEVQIQKIIIHRTSDGRIQRNTLYPEYSCKKSKKTCPKAMRQTMLPQERSVSIEFEPYPLPHKAETRVVHKHVKRPLSGAQTIEHHPLNMIGYNSQPKFVVEDIENNDNIFMGNIDDQSQIPVRTPKRKLVDKDGSLFPGKGCENCQKSGPLIDTGPCTGCHDGPLIDTGPCESCEVLVDTGPCETCDEPVPESEPCNSCPTVLASTPCESCGDNSCCGCSCVAKVEMRDCCSLAPLYLAHVDFNLGEAQAKDNKIGNYRFRIFGCRRYDRDAILNKGRILQKNMDFIQAFEAATGECYNIVKIPDDLCLQIDPSPLPEYILTAEIIDVYMNVCDGYDWDEAKASGTRTGSAEIKVLWRLSNLTKDKILWQGTTTGYADLREGDENGEIKLLEDAFADASSNLRAMSDFEEQLAIRLTPEELTAQRQALIEEEIALDPVKCNYQPNLEQCTPQAPCEVVDDAWSQTQVVDTMCIVDRPPYETLTPENLYKVRASVMEISSTNGKQGSGLIISENFVLTSADLVDGEKLPVTLKTINGKYLTGRIVRVNTGKNIALVKLDQPTEYTPLSLNLDLPKVGQSELMVLGMLNIHDQGGSENFLDNNGKVTGYRYSEDKGSEIMLDTNLHNTTIGGVLIDNHGTIYGIAHTGQKTDTGKDLFLPTETALRSVGLSICEKLYEKPSPWQQTVTKDITIKIMDSAPVAPEALPVEERK